MAVETERRFLLANDSWKNEQRRTSRHVRQGYLSDNPAQIVRVRKTSCESFGHDSCLTIKGLKTNGSGLEFEYRIPANDADQLLAMCQQPILDKTRHVVEIVVGAWCSEFPDDDGECSGVITRKWEIDEFHGDNEGLVIAEIELGDIDEYFSKPEWLGEEITEDVKFANSNLARYPYNTWSTLFY